jgi:hypothetical protein
MKKTISAILPVMVDHAEYKGRTKDLYYKPQCGPCSSTEWAIYCGRCERPVIECECDGK